MVLHPVIVGFLMGLGSKLLHYILIFDFFGFHPWQYKFAFKTALT